MHHLGRALAPDFVKRLLPRTPKRVVIVGGGPTGLFCADRLRHHFEVTVIDPKGFFEFTPGILRALGDPAHLSRITFDYREVLEGVMGVEFILGEASSIHAPAVGGGQGRGHITVTPPSWVGAGAAASSKLHFDYCIAAPGVSNGLWKPRAPGEPAGPPMPPLEQAAGGVAKNPSAKGVEGTADERSLEVRRASIRALRERLAVAREAVIVGAGLVGVELAGELAHFFPRLKLTLVDGAPSVLPQLSEGSREYAQAWLKQQGVRLRLSTSFKPALLGQNEVVLWCVGTKPRSSRLFADPSVLRHNGHIRVNHRMQVIRKSGPGALASSLGSLSSATMPLPDAGVGGAVELEPLGQGRVFAVGDAASVEGVPMAQMIFHGEEMAAIAVANIEAAEGIFSPLSMAKASREAEAGVPLLCCTSLGPQDGMFSTQSELVSTGVLAALQKQLIEDSKMSALRGELLGTLMWMPVH